MTLQQKWFSLLASQPSDYIAGRYLKLDNIESQGKEYIDSELPIPDNFELETK